MGSGGLRWWSGTSWTDHTSAAPEPVAQFVPTSTAHSYSPAGPAPARPYASFATVENGSGRASLWLGIAAFVLVIASTLLPILFVVSALLVPTALVFGIRAPVLRSRGRASETAAPVLGVVFAAITAAVVIFAIVSAVRFLATTSSPDDFTVEETTKRYPNNPEMAAAYARVYDIQHRLHQLYPGRDWPSTLTADSDGAVVLNGETLGTCSRVRPSNTRRLTMAEHSRSFSTAACPANVCSTIRRPSCSSASATRTT